MVLHEIFREKSEMTTVMSPYCRMEILLLKNGKCPMLVTFKK
jgi:hypothetical protein